MATDDRAGSGIVAQAKRALVLFVIVDVLIVLGVIAFYFFVSRPQQQTLVRSRDRAVRASVAMETRLHSVEARAAIRTGDIAAARESMNQAHDRLADLAHAVPTDEAAEAKEVADVAARVELAQSEIDRDTEAARRDLEVAEARLAALYPLSVP